MAQHLTSLEEHNAEILRLYRDPQTDVACPNGISCPKCGRELFDTHPNFMIHGIVPPQKQVHCRCGYKGTRLA